MDNREEIRTLVPDLSVVIVNWNTCAELRQCLESVFAADPGKMEVIVVDNASGDDSPHMVHREFPRVRLLLNSENLGFGKASNQGIWVSKGRYVLLLNPDSVVIPGAFHEAIRFADENGDAGVIGIKILNSDGSLQYSCRSFPTLEAAIFRNTILSHFFPKNAYTKDYLLTEWDHNSVRNVDWVSGAAMLLRRKFLEDVGLLDERFYMYCEDVDICYRGHQKAWRITYFPGAAVVHARGKSSDKSPNRMIIEHHKSMYKFFKKHYLADASLFVRMIVPGGVIARASFFVARNELYRFRQAIKRSRKPVAPEIASLPPVEIEPEITENGKEETSNGQV